MRGPGFGLGGGFDPFGGGFDPLGGGGDPLGGEPLILVFGEFGPDPFGPDPFGPDPFGPDPFGPDPFDFGLDLVIISRPDRFRSDRPGPDRGWRWHRHPIRRR